MVVFVGAELSDARLRTEVGTAQDPRGRWLEFEELDRSRASNADVILWANREQDFQLR